MEISNFSRMLLIEHDFHFSNNKPHKKIGFFDNRMLYKTIGDLKSNLNKKQNIIQNYNPTDIITKRLIKSNINYINKNEKYEDLLSKEIRELDYIESKLNTEERKNHKIILNQKENNDKEIRAISLYKVHFISNKRLKRNSTSNSSLSKTNNLNSELIENKNFQIIKPKNRNNINSEVKNKKAENDKSLIKEEQNILKNKIILGKLNKDSKQEDIDHELSNIKDKLNSKKLVPRHKESDKKSKEKIINFNRNSSVEFDNESVGFYNNKVNKLTKFNSSMGEEAKVDLEIDFIYKKIFDKKSRYLFEKNNIDDNSSQAKKKLKNKLEQENEYLKGIGNSNKNRYIEDKIQDIK